MLFNQRPEQNPTLLKGTQQNPASNHVKCVMFDINQKWLGMKKIRKILQKQSHRERENKIK